MNFKCNFLFNFTMLKRNTLFYDEKKSFNFINLPVYFRAI